VVLGIEVEVVGQEREITKMPRSKEAEAPTVIITSGKEIILVGSRNKLTNRSS
jgi:hypothetical protein